MTDEEVVASCRRGEAGAFEALVRRHQDAVFGMALRFTRSRSDAEDLSQEVFLRVYRGLDRFKGDAKLSTWIYRITANACSDWLRKDRRRRSDTALDSHPKAIDLADGRVNIEERFVAGEERARLAEAIEALDRRYRMAVELVHRQGLSYEEAAGVLGISVRAVETRLYRARAVLRKRLAKEA